MTPDPEQNPLKLPRGTAVASSRNSRARIAILGLALIALAVFGCTPAPSCPPDICPQTTVWPQSDLAHKIQDIYVLLFWLSVVVAVLVEGALLYTMFKFKSRSTDVGRPPQIHGNTALEIGWTIAPAVILVVIAVPTLQLLFEMRGQPPRDALQVEAIGHQWWWEFRYPDSNIITANEVRVPVGQPVNFQLRTADVIHSFWVPQMAGKLDLTPGRRQNLYFTPLTTGEYYGQCTEFCGLQHANMRFRMVVEEPAAYQAWVQRQQQPQPREAAEPDRVGQSTFARAGCIACHTIDGTAAQGTLGPNLTHVGSRTTIAAGILDNTPENLYQWIRDPQAIKPGNLMPNLFLNPDDARAITQYLTNLK
ncbi:MAG: cytochrome c oxidase subunit II [Chloroflexota bacterium]